MEESDSTPADSGLDALEESTSNADLTSEDHTGLYISDFLGEANDGEWGLTIRMARPSRLMSNNRSIVLSARVPTTLSEIAPGKKYMRPCSREGLPNNSAAKAKVQAQNLSTTPLASPQRRKLSKRSSEHALFEPRLLYTPHWPKNWGKAFIDDELTTYLLDNGAQLNFMTPDYAVK